MPVLYIVGGANGSGKTTWYNSQIVIGDIDTSIPFINIDNIVLLELGSYTPENLIAGENIARQRMTGHIEKRESFMIESNLSKTSDYEWIEKMRSAGYETVLYFLGTDDVTVNKDRVLNRVAEGGHDVAVPIIEQRYSNGITYLRSEILKFTEVYLYDSSEIIPKQLAYLKNGLIIEKNNELPLWITKVLFIAEKLSVKKS
jgi:predicted ABC-type ATPase